MEKQKKDFKFEKLAENYDDNFEGKLSKKFYNLITSNIKMNDGCKILDVGCGTGTILNRLSSTCKIDGYGIDVEENMIEQAKIKCPQMNISVCSCDSTPFKDGSFDAVTACMAYHHFPNKEAFIKEAYRLLKKGGRIYVADPCFPFIVRKLMNGVLSLLNVVGEFFVEKELKLQFEKFGFTEVDYKKDSYAQLIVLEK